MKREAEPILRPSKRHEAANMKNALAAMERSGSIYFLKTVLPLTSIPALTTKTSVFLVIPTQFVREHANKIHEWVTLRVQSSNGTSSRPWALRLKVTMLSAASFNVRFVNGWKDFAIGNGLKMGDSLIFLLKEGVRSEFEVHVFRGPEGSPYFPDLCATSSTATDDDDDDEGKKYVSSSEEKGSFVKDSDNDDKQSRVRTRVHHRHARNRASTEPDHETEHSENDKAFPGFRKLLTVSSILRTDDFALPRLGQFEFPRDFVRTHGEHIQASVQLQGVREDSPIFVMPCSRSTRAVDGHRWICFKPREWNRFVTANRLKAGQELQFSLTADSYFKVRKI